MPRTYQPRQIGGLVDIPRPPDAIQSLSGLMTLGRQMEAYSDEQKERKKAKLFEDTYNASGGDLGKMADVFEKSGDRMTADTLRQNKAKIQEQMLAGVVGKVKEHESIHGQARELGWEPGHDLLVRELELERLDHRLHRLAQPKPAYQRE